MRKLHFAIACLFMGALSLNASAQETTEKVIKSEKRLKVGVETVGVVQFLDHKNDDNSFEKIGDGFQSAAANMNFSYNLADGIDVFFELYLSSKHHEGQVTDHEGYFKITHLPESLGLDGLNKIFKYIDIKAGHMEVNFGDWHLRRSDNAQVRNNPLIGNTVVDANTVEVGGEIYGHYKNFEAMIGITNGTTKGDFKDGHKNALYGKLAVNLFDDKFRLSGSYMEVDQSGNPTGYPNNGTYSSLYAGNRSGGRYEAVLTGGPEAGQILPGAGQDVTAWQLDATLKLKPLTIWANYGNSKDADINGSEDGTPEENWNYYMAEVKYDITKSLYLSGRYSGASADKLAGMKSNGKVERLQLGFGLNIIKGLLVKAEYVSQKYKDFDSPDYKYYGMDWTKNPEFNGFVAEVAIYF